MRKLAYLAVAAALLVALQSGLGKATASTATRSESVTQQEADMWEIDQIEVKFHRSTSHHDINLMMSLWAPGAVFNIGTATYTGKAQIRNFFLKINPAFSHHWESDTPSYKIRATVNGDKGTIYFECHYIDPKTSKVVKVVSVNHNVQRINGKWLIVDSAGSDATLSP